MLVQSNLYSSVHCFKIKSTHIEDLCPAWVVQKRTPESKISSDLIHQEAFQILSISCDVVSYRIVWGLKYQRKILYKKQCNVIGRLYNLCTSIQNRMIHFCYCYTNQRVSISGIDCENDCSQTKALYYSLTVVGHLPCWGLEVPLHCDYHHRGVEAEWHTTISGADTDLHT